MIIDRFWLCSSDHRALKSCEKLVLPHGSIMLRAASESSLSHKSGPYLGKSFSLAQVPLRKLELRALSLLVTVYCLQQNSEVSIRTWEKQLCSNYTFCTGTFCFICLTAKFMRLPTSGSRLFPATVITFPILLLLPSVFLSTVSFPCCFVGFFKMWCPLFPLMSNPLSPSHSFLSDFLPMPCFYSDSFSLKVLKIFVWNKIDLQTDHRRESNVPLRIHFHMEEK